MLPSMQRNVKVRIPRNSPGFFSAACSCHWRIRPISAPRPALATMDSISEDMVGDFSYRPRPGLAGCYKISAHFLPNLELPWAIRRRRTSLITPKSRPQHSVMTKLSPAAARAQAAYHAAADHYDDPALAFWERFGRVTVTRLELPRGARVLDVCCGS